MTMTSDERGRGVDAAMDRRPGVPMEREPRPVGNAHWGVPEKQQPRGEVLMDPGRDELTATFGSGEPPRGMSGMLRRAAYRIPDYYARRWMLLMLADRVDAMENGLGRALSRPSTWMMVLGALGAVTRMSTLRRRRHRGIRGVLARMR